MSQHLLLWRLKQLESRLLCMSLSVNAIARNVIICRGAVTAAPVIVNNVVQKLENLHPKSIQGSNSVHGLNISPVAPDFNIENGLPVLGLLDASQQKLKGWSPYADRESVTASGDVADGVDKWVQTKPSLRDLAGYYSKLSKARLTGLVVLTAACGYALAPAPFVAATFAYCAIGTTLCSASANSLNQVMEVPYDCQMSRTRDRVLVRGLLRPTEALIFGSICGTAGVSMLAACVNPITAALGAANIILYAGIYTPSKRFSIANTWIGSVVGAIPPLMGWAACTGGLDFGALILGGMLFSWQFPHFNALSWNYRPDYSRAGYKMMSVTDPGLCRRVTLRHALAQIPLAVAMPFAGVTSSYFVLASMPVNLYLIWLSYRFYKTSNNKSARKLFMYSLLHLPLLMLLLLVFRQTHQGVAIDKAEPPL